MQFFQGNNNLLEEKDKEKISLMKKNISKIFSSSHLSFLLGAGCSAKAIPTMNKMWDNIQEKQGGMKDDIKNAKDIEKALEILFARQFYLEHTNQEGAEQVRNTIDAIKEHIFNACNCIEKNSNSESTLKTYKSFYKKLMYREHALSKINIFTTNYDLFNEKAMDDLGIIYCNGFSGTIHRYFNPMTFNYAYTEQINLSKEKYNILDKYIYLYKLHGSINWIEINNNNSLFKIQEIQSPAFKDNQTNGENHIMIYPTPTKQSSSLASPYSDLLREFQKKLLIQDNLLVVIGYSFADEHINNIIYQALATIPKFRLIIFSYEEIKENEKTEQNEIEKLKNYDDPRIWIIACENCSGENIADFNYIIDNFLLETNEDDETLNDTMYQYRIANNNDTG